MAKLDLPHKTNEEVLAAWDDGMPVWSCAMGGIGPGYEQCIQLMAFEMLRSMMQHPAPPPLEEPELQSVAHRAMTSAEIEENKKKKEAHQQAWQKYSDLIEATPNVKKSIQELEVTGAQFGVAMNLASVFLIQGYEKAMEMVPDDRAIFVSKKFPGLKVAKNVKIPSSDPPH